MVKKLIAPIIVTLNLILPALGSAESVRSMEFSLITVNMNGVPDILRLPQSELGKEIVVNTEHLRWEENFYLLAEPRASAATDLKIEQKQINCLSHPGANLGLLKEWPKRESRWKEMTFVGTNRYKGAEFDQEDLSSPALQNLEAFINSQDQKNKKDKLAIAKEITAAPERHSYHCETLIKISSSSLNEKQKITTFRIRID